MKWLHLSDIHFNPNLESNRNTKQLRTKLIQYIKDNELRVDEIFITGDFRNALSPCSNEDKLVRDIISFIDEVAKTAGIKDHTHIHIVPGNHDLQRCELNPELDIIRENYDYNNGIFSSDVLKQLIARFGFYAHIKNDLYEHKKSITTDELSLHSHKCYDNYALVYLNTAISCGNNKDRGSLVVGNSELYSQLESIKKHNPSLPIIVLAHHSPELFNPKEKDVIEKLFLDYNVKLYLCGDSHEISCKKINNVLEYTTGCMTFDKDVSVTFAYGELSGNKHDIKSFFWDSRSMQWGIYDPFNQHYRKIISSQQTLLLSPTSLLLNDNWFKEQNQSQILNLGQRYSPEVNVETSFAQIFDYIAKNNFFKNDLIKKSDNVVQSLRKINNDDLNPSIQQLIDEIESLNLSANVKTDFEKIISLVENVFKIVEKEISKENEKRVQESYKLNCLNQTYSVLENYHEYLNSEKIKLVNMPICILSGDGGAGKSHLIADTVERRNIFHEKSILLLGQHFNNSDNPFEQMKKLLNINCSFDEMLIAFNEIGKQQSTRLIIFIDAINEGGGITVWKNYLQEMILKINEYSCIGLVISVRSHYTDVLYRDTNLKNMSIEVKHTGFALNGEAATKKYFEYYKINYNDVPLSIEDFQNPLFLKLFCETYKNQSIENRNITLSSVYENYLKEINKRIAEKCNYDDCINVVEEALKLIAQLRHSKNNSSNVMSIQHIIDIVVKVQHKYNITGSLLIELLSSGILTKEINEYNEEERIFITFERLEDYLYSEILVSSLIKKGIDIFTTENKTILHRTDLLEFFSVLLAEKTEYEIFDAFTEDTSVIREAFIGGLKWRQANSISKKTLEFINTEIVKYEYSFKLFVEALILLSTKKNHPLNAERTVNYIIGFAMPDRDAVFIEIFDKAFQGETSIINVLLDWCLNKNNTVDHETIKLAAITIPLFFITPNNTLRDKSTKALICLLNGETEILIETLEYFKKADDPYIIERLYAVAFGCIVREKDKEKIKKIALAIYENVFNGKKVYPNVLLRDYAKNTIDYAISVLGHLDIDVSKTIPPYKSQFPVIPSDDEIEAYNLDYNAPDFKDYYRSQNSILSSMKVEYTRDGQPGGYGDFGRYVFQRYFDSWKQLNPNDLMNIAVKKVFDIGYDVEKHGKYDRGLKYYNRGHSQNERIGKKYQWIALYELAAQVADNYKLEQYIDDHGTTTKTYCKGSFEPSIRNIDPTISYGFFDSGENGDYKPIHNELYNISNDKNNDWIANFSDLPDSYSLLHTDFKNDNFILLNGGYSWTEDKQLGFKKYELPQKQMWININSYIVKKEQLGEYISKLKGKNFMGRWLSEPHERSTLFNREYYWSIASKETQNQYYGCDEFDYITERDQEFENLEKVLMPAYIYYTERNGDLSGESNHSWYKPCDTLYNNLDLKYGNEDTALYDSKGKLICFDSQELLNENIGFFIDEKVFYKFLEENNYACFWTILSEKRIIGGNWTTQKNFGNIIKSGIIYLDQNNNFNESINTFINE